MLAWRITARCCGWWRRGPACRQLLKPMHARLVVSIVRLVGSIVRLVVSIVKNIARLVVSIIMGNASRTCNRGTNGGIVHVINRFFIGHNSKKLVREGLVVHGMHVRERARARSFGRQRKSCTRCLENKGKNPLDEVNIT
ncbi:unnamed protein product [Linum trigynum]|uniref:Secreted protein n=1 Tax=Linum trigynum TaxID=586398 RepID=A0AAV2GQZ6_9ROSI